MVLDGALSLLEAPLFEFLAKEKGDGVIKSRIVLIVLTI
jgi:hypothetical protein